MMIWKKYDNIGKHIKAPLVTRHGESTCKAGNMSSITGSGRCSGEGNGNVLQYSCLGNPWTGVWQTAVHGVTKSQTQLSD